MEMTRKGGAHNYYNIRHDYYDDVNVGMIIMMM